MNNGTTFCEADEEIATRSCNQTKKRQNDKTRHKRSWSIMSLQKPNPLIPQSVIQMTYDMMAVESFFEAVECNP